MVIAVSGAVIDNALRASPLAEIDQNRLVGRTGLFKRGVRRERTGARSTVKFVHNVRPPVPGIRLRGRFSIQIAPHGPGGAASDIGISEPLGEDGDRDAAWPLGPDPGKITPVTCSRIVALGARQRASSRIRQANGQSISRPQAMRSAHAGANG